ncbi:hypothetical protein E2I00_011005, partial [Balaenoptera physalus]
LLGCSPCTQHDCGCQGILEKSRFGTEFHQFLIERAKLGHFEEFYGLLQHVHKIPNVDILLGYTDIQGYLLSINKDDNYHITASTTNLLLRIFTQKKRKKQTVPLFIFTNTTLNIPYGLYSWDGFILRETLHGLEKVPGIFCDDCKQLQPHHNRRQVNRRITLGTVGLLAALANLLIIAFLAIHSRLNQTLSQRMKMTLLLKTAVCHTRFLKLFLLSKDWNG